MFQPEDLSTLADLLPNCFAQVRQFNSNCLDQGFSELLRVGTPIKWEHPEHPFCLESTKIPLNVFQYILISFASFSWHRSVSCDTRSANDPWGALEYPRIAIDTHAWIWMVAQNWVSNCETVWGNFGLWVYAAATSKRNFT